MVAYTKQFLAKLEALVEMGGFLLRYEKGNFKSGYCILESSRVVVVNKFASMDNKINIIVDLIQNLEFNEQMLDEKNTVFLHELKQTVIKF
ncbi:MAG: hypothetical protein WCL14_12225 [Bacteroidota bacterium]